jgi:hypothetical protein
MTREAKPLETTSEAESIQTLFPAGDSFVFAGTEPEGLNYLCPTCGWTAAFNVAPGQIRDLAVQCPRCKRSSRFLPVKESEPIPPRTSFVFLSHEIRLVETIRIPHRFALFIGRDTAERYSRETGTVVQWRTNPAETPKVEIDPRTGLRRGSCSEPTEDPTLDVKTVASIEKRFRVILGTELSAILDGESPNLLPDSLPGHPIVMEIEAARAAEISLRTGSGPIDHGALIQAMSDLLMLERWRRHPHFRDCVGRLVDPREYRSAIGSLALATTLADAGNGVSLGKQEKDGKAPDLRVRTLPDKIFGIETKAPEKLYRPTGTLTRSDARVLIERRVAEVVGTSVHSGQIRPDLPGILALVGYSMPRDWCDTLHAATTETFLTDGSQEGLLAVVILNVTWYSGGRRTERKAVLPKPGERVGSFFELYPSEHPNHAGRVYLSRESMRWSWRAWLEEGGCRSPNRAGNRRPK